MRKIFMAILLVLAVIGVGLLVFTLLNSPEDAVMDEDSNSMKGVIAQIKDGQLLLVQGLTPEEIKSLSETEILTMADSSAYFAVTEEVELEELEVGMRVKLWYEVLDTSNPAYGVSDRVEVLE